MELRQLVQTLLRRWYLLAGVLLVATSVSFGVVRTVGPTFSAQATVVLMPPASSWAGQGAHGGSTNPYLFLSGLVQARDVLVRALTSDASRTTVARAYPHATFSVLPDPGSSGPIILITAEAPTSDEAKAASSAVVRGVPQTLRRLQDGLGIPGQSAITALTLTRDNHAQLIRKGQMRAGIVALAASLGLGILLISVIDRILLNRRERPVAEKSSQKTGDRSGKGPLPVPGSQRARPKQSSGRR